MFACKRRQGQTREKLVTTAADLLMRQSFGTVSVDDICKAAGVKKGTFYHHFPSKMDLALAAYDHMWAMARQKLDACFSATLTPSTRLEAYAEGAYRFHLEIFEKEGKIYGCPIAGAGQEMAAQDEAIRRKTEEIFDGHCRYFESVLLDMDNYRTKPREALRNMSREMFSYVMGVMYQAKVTNDPEVIRRDLLSGLKRLLGDNPSDKTIPDHSVEAHRAAILKKQ